MHLLVVDDDSPTRKLLAQRLQTVSSRVTTAGSCAAAEAATHENTFDVIVLDVMLPDGSGVDLCRKLRAEKVTTPVLLLTARGQVRDRVDGLDAGADDYLVKPFAVLELLARVKALARRGPILRDRTIHLGPLSVDLELRRVRVDDHDVPLTAKELAIVEVLASKRGGIVERATLVESVWGEVTDSAEASLEVLVGRIRRKLGSAAPALRTVRGLGYALSWER